MKIIIHDRLATINMLASPKVSCLAYNFFKIFASTAPVNNFYNESVISDAPKITFTSLLDRTDIRFFTIRIIEKLFINSGFTHINITRRIFDFLGQNKALRIIKEAAISYKINLQDAILDAETYQYTVVGKFNDKI